jgi:hypothetical protein
MFRDHNNSDSRKRSKKEDAYKQLSKASKSIRRHSKNSGQEVKDNSNIDLPEICENNEIASKEDNENEDNTVENIKKKLTLRLSEEELTDEWNLKPGLNEVSFSVTTQYQGNITS